MKPSLKKVMYWVLASNFYGSNLDKGKRFVDAQNRLEEEIINYYRKN